MFEFLKSLFKPSEPHVPELGALIDDRPEEEKEKDYNFEEIVASATAPIWVEKKSSEYRVFGSQNQSKSSSCVAQALRKALRVLFQVNHNLDLDFSASDIYRRRSNKPQEGMIPTNAFDIARDGVTLNALMPSDKKTEGEMNNPKDIAGTELVRDAFKLPNYVVLPVQDIETVASVIEKTGKGVFLLYYFTGAEWSQYVPNVQIPNLPLRGASTYRHAVCAVDYTLYKGRKCLVIDDSAHFGSMDRRLITEDFHRKRNFFAGYPMRFSFDPVPGKPVYNGSVVSLQECLKVEGVFPTNIDSTGTFGSITRKAVVDFQKKHGLEPVGNVGPKTSALLYKLYP